MSATNANNPGYGKNSLLTELETLREFARCARECFDEMEYKGGVSDATMTEYKELLVEAEALMPPVYKERRVT